MSGSVSFIFDNDDRSTAALAASMSGVVRALGLLGWDARVFGSAGQDGTATRAYAENGPVAFQALRSGDEERLCAECDVLHVLGWGHDAGRRAVRAALRCRVPYVISPFGGLTISRYRRVGWRDRLRGLLGECGLIRGASAILAINEFERASIMERGFGAEVIVSPLGLSFDDCEAIRTERCDRVRESDALILLVPGAIEPVNGGVPLLKAFAEMGEAADRWRVVFVGAEVGDWRKQMEAAVRRKGGSDRVSFDRAASDEQMRSWIARADAVACVALHPAAPTALIQALAVGVPVLASTVNAPDMPNGAIITCAPSREGIATGLRCMMSMTNDERDALGQRGCEQAKSYIEASAVAARLSEILRKAAAKYKNASAQAVVGV